MKITWPFYHGSLQREWVWQPILNNWYVFLKILSYCTDYLSNYTNFAGATMWQGGFPPLSSRQTPFLAWPGGVKPSSSRQTPIVAHSIQHSNKLWHAPTQRQHDPMRHNITTALADHQPRHPTCWWSVQLWHNHIPFQLWPWLRRQAYKVHLLIIYFLFYLLTTPMEPTEHLPLPLQEAQTPNMSICVPILGFSFFWHLFQCNKDTFFLMQQEESLLAAIVDSRQIIILVF